MIFQVAQVVAYELGIPLSMVTVKGATSTVAGNNTPTGGSVTSECCCQVLNIIIIALKVVIMG